MLKRNLRFDILTDRRCTVMLHHATSLGDRGHGVDAYVEICFQKESLTFSSRPFISVSLPDRHYLKICFCVVAFKGGLIPLPYFRFPNLLLVNPDRTFNLVVYFGVSLNRVGFLDYWHYSTLIRLEIRGFKPNSLIKQ